MQKQEFEATATIGHFTPAKDGYEGTIRTLTMNVKARFVAVDKKPSDKVPDFRICAGKAELGAAWSKKTNGDGEEYLSVTLDDPSLLAPVHTALFEKDSKAQLVWNRKKGATRGC